MFLRVSAHISREQERAADRRAADAFGAGAMAGALLKTYRLAPLWDVYFEAEVVPLFAARDPGAAARGVPPLPRRAGPPIRGDPAYPRGAAPRALALGLASLAREAAGGAGVREGGARCVGETGSGWWVSRPPRR